MARTMTAGNACPWCANVLERGSVGHWVCSSAGCVFAEAGVAQAASMTLAGACFHMAKFAPASPLRAVAPGSTLTKATLTRALTFGTAFEKIRTEAETTAEQVFIYGGTGYMGEIAVQEGGCVGVGAERQAVVCAAVSAPWGRPVGGLAVDHDGPCV